MNVYRNLAKIVAIGVLTMTVASLSPAFAQGHSSGGGHASSGGGHMSSGGAHASFSGGSHAHYAVGGGHFAPSYAGGYRTGYYGPRRGFYGGNWHGGNYWHGGYWGGGYWHGGYWNGGYWHGGFYGPRFGFGWFLPVLPAFYATYYFGGIPYYYANDAYYTWSPSYNGYVATEPPSGAAAADAAPDAQTAPPANGPGPANGAAPDSQTYYTYPKSGQTAEQQASDRNECQQWASSQSGYDSSRADAPAAGGQEGDYHRALTACLEGRGYSVR